MFVFIIVLLIFGNILHSYCVIEFEYVLFQLYYTTSSGRIVSLHLSLSALLWGKISQIIT